jgi:hypothetical protein
MALPKIDVPIHTIDLPLTKKKIRYRPFLVKEEKILLMAMESQDENTIFDSIKQIVNNCSLDELDVDDLPITDLEYFFLHLRARSVSEVVDLQYKCNNKIKEQDCGNIVKVKVNILEIKPEFQKDHSTKIQITDELGLIMKYPSLKVIQNIKSENEVDRLMEIILKCIDAIYDKTSMYYTKDVSEEELKDFVEGLTQQQFVKVQKFFESVPKMKKNLSFKCNKCGYEDTVLVEGIQNFFE